ncbi:MAG TPA: tetratricopeptide repeat protein [Bacteroidia bacterium]|nr:tetratricopeptide repeat protein [Bacteroidia bacterium]
MIKAPINLSNILFRLIVMQALWLYLSGCTNSHKEGKNETEYASLNDSTEYVGMATCRQCHSTIYDSYIQTGMGQSFGIAERERSSAVFSPHSIIRDSVLGYQYHPYLQSDSLYVLEFLMNGKDTSYQRRVHINYIVGSGQHTNSHIRNVNDYLYQVPVTYYTQDGKWDLPPGFEGGFNSRFGRKIELECMSCHNAMPQLVSGSENKYLKVPNGIDCERCHGPGGRHVEEKSRGIFVDTSKYIDYTIVNPSKLSINLQMDVCQRCHIQGNAILNEGKSFSDFRPGMPLSSVMNVFMPVYAGDDDKHIMASHAERLKMSKCFSSSLENSATSEQKNNLKPYKNALTCITCHNPHVSVKHTGKEVFNAACLSCHSSSVIEPDRENSKNQSACTESESSRRAVGNNCVSCHMPSNSSIDIPHVVSTDHYIRKPVTLKDKAQIREFVGLVCINNPDVDSVTRAKAFISYYEKFSSNPGFLDSAKGLIPSSTKEDIEKHFKVLVHWAFLKGDYPQLLHYNKVAWGAAGFKGRVEASNSDAWTSYRIGQAFEQVGDPVAAEINYQLAVDKARFQPDFRNKLASIQHDLKKVDEAINNYQFILRENPEFVPAYTNYGFLLLSEKGDVNGAKIMYQKALSLDPLNEQARLNMAGLLIYQKKYSEAKILIKEIMKLYPNNSQARSLYAKFSQIK